jgi:Phage integrase family
LILCSIISVVFTAARGGVSVAILISKSKYMAGVQCLTRLYLLVHRPELGHGKTAADFAHFDQGRQVGKLAQRLFPGGVEGEVVCRFGFHNLRHGLATWLAEPGTDPMVIPRMLRDSSKDMTMHYIHAKAREAQEQYIAELGTMPSASAVRVSDSLR